MLKKRSAAIIYNCVSAVLVLTVLPRCVIPIQADNSPNKDGPAVHIPALLNVTLLDSNGNTPKLLWRIEGQYGQDSPKTEAKGTIIAPVPINGVADRLGCDRQTRFLVPPNTKHWVALLHRGNCTFKEKILRAAAFNASAVIIYNNMSKEETITMAHTERQMTDNRIAHLFSDSAETDPDFNHCAVCIEGYKLNDVVRILPCKHVFHKMCVDPWLNEHCTCPMCKLNILKALGIMPNLPCVDNVAFDMDMISRSQTSSQRSILGDSTNENSINMEPLRHSGTSQIPLEAELTPRSGEINIAVTSKSPSLSA
ncbi:UNVERIFIED_CONTAM: hypothetical protein FKN15_019857 [Acipenser sinensis]